MAAFQCHSQQTDSAKLKVNNIKPNGCKFCEKVKCLKKITAYNDAYTVIIIAAKIGLLYF